MPFFAALRAAVSCQKSAEIFCTKSTFLGYLRKSSSKLSRNWHHLFSSKRGSVPILEPVREVYAFCLAEWVPHAKQAEEVKHKTISGKLIENTDVAC